MGKLRVHELAKKLGMSNAELIAKLSAVGIAAKTHSSSVDEPECIKALGLGKPAEKAPTSTRTRTLVRRRRQDEGDGVAAEGGEETAPLAELAPVEEAPVAAEPAEPAVAVAAFEEAEVKPEPAPQPERAPEPAPEVVAVAAPAATATATAEPAPVAAAAPAPPVGDGAPASAAAPEGDGAQQGAAGPTNVVRRIDAAAIKERLAAEGRTFTPPRPKRTFSQVREIRVLHDRSGGGPQLVDVTGQGGRPGPRRGAGPAPAGSPSPGFGGAPPGGAPGGGRPDDFLSSKERREIRGGRDLWFHPGKKRKTGKKGRGPEITQAAQHKRVVEIADVITVADLAHQMAIKAGQVIAKLMGMGMMVTVNQTIDYETAAIVASEFGFECKNVAFQEEDLLAKVQPADEGDEVKKPRAPVVTVMGHVDHGKTSLLDYIRNANVVAGEAGGITQHIGAYSVETERGNITFLDTPGHEAFTAMRARGAQITDIVILVVAADDGVMPQTVEAINHAKAAKVPLVVAINKCDKPDAKPERVMQELTEHGLVPEAWGGEAQMVQVSAKKGTGIPELLEGVLLQAEVLELRANPDKRAEGAVVEAQLDKGRGPVATVLVQQGTLHPGDFIVAGEQHGRVRAMYDSTGNKVEEAGPSTPVLVLGLSGVPSAGDTLNAVTDDKTAKRVAEHRTQKNRERELQQDSRVSLENFLSKPVAADDTHELRLVVKADVDGSLEALKQALENLSTKKVKVSVVHSGVGTITESDINLAVTSDAIVIGFNIKPDSKGLARAQHEKVDVRTYTVIYEALDEVRAAMAGMLAPKIEERFLGKAEVRQLFTVPKLGTIAGSYVTDGKILRSGKVRVLREKKQIFEGQLASLKRFKDDAREVGTGFECGIAVHGFNDLQPGDVLECFEQIEVKAELDEALVNLEPARGPPPSEASGASA